MQKSVREVAQKRGRVPPFEFSSGSKREHVAPAWPESAFARAKERDVVVDRIEGKIPDDLTGAFYRIGPGALDTAGSPNAHWFDGDGMVSAFFLSRGACTFRSRFVATPWRAREEKEGKRLFTAFAAVAPTLRGHLRRPKNPANTNVLTHGDRLLALYEGGRPFALDAKTLRTLGEETFARTLPLLAGFSAHPHVDRKTGALVSVGLGARLTRHGLGAVADVWEAAPNGVAKKNAPIPLDHADVIHSVGFTERHVAVLLGPYGLDRSKLPGFVAGRHGLLDTVAWREKDPLAIYLADREGRDSVRRYELPAAFVIHVANAFEDGDDTIVDAVLHPDPRLIESIRVPFAEPACAPGHLTRIRLAPDGRVTTTRLCEIGMEFPRVRDDLDGVAHRYVYAGRFERDDGVAAPTSVLLKTDTRNGKTLEHDLGEGCIFGEPVVVPRRDGKRAATSAEDDAWVLSFGYDTRRNTAFLAILSAQSFSEVARLHLPFHVPVGLHASFTPEER